MKIVDLKLHVLKSPLSEPRAARRIGSVKITG
jgi:hypothetical protein